MYIYTYIYIYICMYTYIYIYILGVDNLTFHFFFNFRKAKKGQKCMFFGADRDTENPSMTAAGMALTQVPCMTYSYLLSKR